MPARELPLLSRLSRKTDLVSLDRRNVDYVARAGGTLHVGLKSGRKLEIFLRPKGDRGDASLIMKDGESEFVVCQLGWPASGDAIDHIERHLIARPLKLRLLTSALCASAAIAVVFLVPHDKPRDASERTGIQLGQANAGGIPLARVEAEPLRAALEAALAQRQGGFSRPVAPVSLDNSPAPGGNEAPAERGVSTRPATQAKATVPAETAPQATAPNAPVTSPAPEPKTAGEGARGLSSLDVNGAKALLDTLRDLKAKSQGGEAITPNMLATLPPEIASQLRASIEAKGARPSPPAAEKGGVAGAVEKIERLNDAVLAKARKDQYGIPDIPPANTWAATNGNVVLPLPGGGDIRQPDDMKTFGLEP